MRLEGVKICLSLFAVRRSQDPNAIRCSPMAEAHILSQRKGPNVGPMGKRQWTHYFFIARRVKHNHVRNAILAKGE